MTTLTDTGYAWVIPIACCFINATLFGAYRSYGILYSVLLDNYKVTRSVASWPFSLCMTVIHLTGPISGTLNMHFTTRTIMFAGCALAALGVGLCYTAHSVLEITLYIGIIQGFGIGLTYIQNNEIINQYFIKFRATANGISLAGGTVGAFALSYLVEWALRYFNLNECFLLLAIVILATLPVCILLKPFKETEADDKLKNYDRVMNIATVYLKSYDMNGKHFSGSNGITQISANFARRESLIVKPVKSLGKLMVDSLRDMERRVSNAAGEDHLSAAKAIADKVKSAQLSESESTWSSINDILRCPIFILIALTHMAYFWASITYMMIIVDYAGDKNIPVNMSVQLINAFSAGDLIGRLGSGWLMDNKLIPLKYLSLVSSVGIGLLLQVTIVSHGFYAFLVISALLGLLSGLMNILLNILFCKYMGTSRASLAFGLSAFFCGLVTLARPMVVGYFRDSERGSYDGLLLVLGSVSAAVGALWLFEPLLRKKKVDEEEVSSGDGDDSLPPIVVTLAQVDVKC